MKHRIVRLTWLTVVLGLIAPPLLAERNLIPSLEGIPDVCSERPNEPDWMQNIALRDAYQRVLVQDIYRAQSIERVVETGSCDCATRFPTWDSAEVTFRENHADADRSGMLHASDTYNRRANEFRSQAQAICEAAGNW
ncbi:hypothetical protein [Thalassovita taeanensis]|uniref:Uncharacterized protein n=1 Tax=Thalassovita taeanensis TaxID=657014 RepID=A0A1H9IX26_9RHOB|nr:hypothetical protein [Thalassovita taeanensis]SEQ79092.1 hypothetical protein SAMN04488092_11353 [Thalassovita taeanensis]